MAALCPPHCFPARAALGHLIRVHQPWFVRNLRSYPERMARLSCHQVQHFTVTQLTFIYSNGNNVALFQISFHPSCSQNTVKPAGPCSHFPWEQLCSSSPWPPMQRAAERSPAGGGAVQFVQGVVFVSGPSRSECWQDACL